MALEAPESERVMEDKVRGNPDVGNIDNGCEFENSDELVSALKDIKGKAEELDEKLEGITMEGNTTGDGQPIPDQKIRVRADGAKIHRMSVADDFKAKNIRGCYKAFRKMGDNENADDKLFKHYHYSGKEIEVMHAEVERLRGALGKLPHSEVDSVFLNVKQVIEDYEIPPVEAVVENSQD